MPKRFLTLLLFCASLSGVALADAPAGNGSNSANQGSPNTYQNAWPFYFGPGGVPYQASWIQNANATTCSIISSSALNWGIALINQSSSAQTNTLTIWNGTTCAGTNVNYNIVPGASAYYVLPFPLAAWNTGASYKWSAAPSGLVSIVYY